MKILHIINSFEDGGAEKLTLQLHEALLNQGIDSHAVSFKISSTGDLPNTHVLGFNSPYRFSVLLKLYSFLSQPQWQDLDIIHVHLFPAQLFTPIVSRIANLNAYLITTEHDTYNRRRNYLFGKLIDGFTYSLYTKIICISPGTKTALLEWQPQISNKLSIIYNGINIDDYSLNSNSLPQTKVPVIISVGRLVKKKNYETAIRALSKIHDCSYEYWILGSGSLEAELIDIVSSLNLESKIKFLGFRKDVPELLQQADIFLLTSLWEGFGLAVVEGMAAGLPVVVSDVPGVREVVTSESKSGFLVNPLSEDDIAQKLNKLIKNQSLRLTMGQNARLHAAKFNIKQTVKEYIHLYRDVCQLTN